MLTKKTLAIGFAIALLFLQTVHAVALNPRGTGEVLLFPYYTVNADNDTLFTITNSKNEVKALKIRFFEGRHGREVLDFNIYLAPFDTWTGALTSVEDNGPAVLITNDQSCTVPDILGRAGSRVSFRNFLFAGNDADGAGESLTRTREGFFEVIEMGVVASDLDDGEIGDELGDWAIPEQDGYPINCTALDSAWAPSADSLWANNPQQDMSSPTGGLYGSTMIISVLGGYQASYSADTLTGFYDPQGPLSPSLHSTPGATQPNLNDGNPVATVLDTQGNSVEASFDRPVDAVSAVLMSQSLRNEFIIDSALDAATEWVVTFPTSAFYVLEDEAIPPFTTPWSGETEAGAGDAQGAEIVELSLVDWAGLVDPPNTGGPFFMGPPPSPPPPALAYASNVIAFSRAVQAPPASSLLGSTDYFEIDVNALILTREEGQMGLSFSQQGQVLTSLEGLRFRGLPANGMSIQVARNRTLDLGGGPVLSNYAGAVKHRSTIEIQPPGVPRTIAR